MDEDGLPVDEVGPWAREKHDRLRKYIDASRGARRKFTKGPGGSTYIDLFSGAGRAIISDAGELIDGSPLVAFKMANAGNAPFSSIHLADVDADKVTAALKRLRSAGGDASTVVGEAEKTVKEIVARLNPYGLHFVLLDPFNLNALPFSIIETLASLRYVDLLIHVSVQDLQRNLRRYTADINGSLDRFAPGWRETVNYAYRIDILRKVPAAVRFVSFEPLLGPVRDPDLRDIHWAIVGGESGPQARPMESSWAEHLRDSCLAQDVAFFFKQWGGKRKKATGRVLGDRTWDDYPAQASAG